MKEEAGKLIEVGQLVDVLKKLPGGYKAACNIVGNLMIVNEKGDFVGAIDFIDGEFESFEGHEL